jgi:hypothetical protein
MGRGRIGEDGWERTKEDEVGLEKRNGQKEGMWRWRSEGGVGGARRMDADLRGLDSRRVGTSRLLSRHTVWLLEGR